MTSSAKKLGAAPRRSLEGRTATSLTARELADAGRRAGLAARRELAEAGITVAAVRDGKPVWVRPDGSVEPATWDQVRAGYPG
ncbi:MAG: hypothetical protein IT546_12400 [Caulobacteraceae bacterium]|nr:hypothetical protein [Caulobacteraceae bacterium]